MESWRLPQGRAVDSVRWLPSSAAAWERMLLSAFYSSETGKSSVELSALRFNDDARLELQAEWSHADRISALAAASVQGDKSVVATGTRKGNVGLFVVDVEGSSTVASDVISSCLHQDSVSGLDVQGDTGDCLSVGEDGKINVVKLRESELSCQKVYDSHGLLSFSTVRWASPMECVTAGVGTPIQWWDLRRPGGSVSHCRLKWDGLTPGIIHSVDVHPSRKHLCVMGGSAGSVFAWDLRSHKEPVKLVDVSQSAVTESEIWEVKYDNFMPASGYGSDTGKLPPVMFCSEDGILGIVEGGSVTELLAQPCAINSFDIDQESGKDIVCALEFESIAVLQRST